MVAGETGTGHGAPLLRLGKSSGFIDVGHSGAPWGRIPDWSPLTSHKTKARRWA
jgi:hypothetical protein